MNGQPDIDDLFPGSTAEPPGMGELTPTLIEGELRIRDVDLAARLGFARPTNIRQLIERHRESLSKISILHTVVQVPEGAGRPSTVYYLNRKQALFITAKSGTPKAVEITIEIIHRFDAFERGDIRYLRRDHPVLTSDDRSAVGGIVKRVTASQIRPLLQMQAVDHAHIVASTQKIAAMKAAPQPVEHGACRAHWPTPASAAHAVTRSRHGRGCITAYRWIVLPIYRHH